MAWGSACMAEGLRAREPYSVELPSVPVGTMAGCRAAVKRSSQGGNRCGPFRPSCQPVSSPQPPLRNTAAAAPSQPQEGSRQPFCQRRPALIQSWLCRPAPYVLETERNEPTEPAHRCAPQGVPRHQWRSGTGFSDERTASRRPLRRIDHGRPCWVRAVPRAGPNCRNGWGCRSRGRRCENPLPGRRRSRSMKFDFDEEAFLGRSSMRNERSGRHQVKWSRAW